MTQPVCGCRDLLHTLGLPFRHVRVRPLLKHVTWPLEECFQRLAPQGVALKIRRSMMGFPTDRLTPHETVQICLLWTRPFREPLADGCIRDLRYPDRAPYQWRDRPQLIEACANALLWYEMTCQAIEGIPQGLPAQMVYAARVMESTLQLFFHLRDHEKLPPDNPLYDRRRPVTLAQARELGSLMRRLASDPRTPAWVRTSTPPHVPLNKAALFTQMRDAFRSRAQDLPYVARDYAIVVILQDFGIEAEDDPAAIADHYRQRLRRRQS